MGGPNSWNEQRHHQDPGPREVVGEVWGKGAPKKKGETFFFWGKKPTQTFDTTNEPPEGRPAGCFWGEEPWKRTPAKTPQTLLCVGKTQFQKPSEQQKRAPRQKGAQTPSGVFWGFDERRKEKSQTGPKAKKTSPRTTGESNGGGFPQGGGGGKNLKKPTVPKLGKQPAERRSHGPGNLSERSHQRVGFFEGGREKKGNPKKFFPKKKTHNPTWVKP